MVNLMPSGSNMGIMSSPKAFILYLVFAHFMQTLLKETLTFWKFENKCDKIDIPSFSGFD